MTLATVILFIAAISLDSLFQAMQAPSGKLWTAALYGVLLALCIWMRCAGRHDLAWIIAAAPNPLLVVGLSLPFRPFVPAPVHESATVAAVSVCIWVTLIGFVVRATRSLPLDDRDLDFSLDIAALVNLVALAALALPATHDTGQPIRLLMD